VRPAYAQADDPTTKAARARFQEGVDFYDKGQFENARASFLQAYALRKHPAVLLNLAQSCLKSNHTLEAARYFTQYLRESTAITAGQRNDAEKGLVEARMKLGRMMVDAPSGSEIFVDDDRIGVTPLRDPVDIEPGSHVVKARGRTDESITVSATAGQTVTARFGASNPPPVVAAVPAPAPAPPPNPPPPAEVPAEPPPAADNSATSEPPPGSDRAGGGLLSPPKNVTPVVLGVIVAAGGFGTAIAMGVAKQSAQNSADSVAEQIRANLLPGQQAQGICASNKSADVARYGKACAALNDDNDKVNTDATIANIGLGVGIAASVFTVIYWLAASKRDASSAKWKAPVITPMFGGGTGGMSVSGGF
jgi:hypothetical protein